MTTVAEKEFAEKEARRTARVRAEHNSMLRVERLPGVKEVRAALEYRDAFEADRDGTEREVKKGRLTAEAELADGRLVQATATNAFDLERLLYGRVKEALAERPVKAAAAGKQE